MMLNLRCYLDEILNYLADIPVSMFNEGGVGGGERHPECEWHHPIGWVPGVNKEEKEGIALHFQIPPDQALPTSVATPSLL